MARVALHSKPYLGGDGESTLRDEQRSELINEVKPPEDELVVEVQGLESCTAPNAGGPCVQP